MTENIIKQIECKKLFHDKWIKIKNENVILSYIEISKYVILTWK